MNEKLFDLCVVVPAYNEADSIEESLQRLHDTLRTEFPGTFQIVLVDDGSRDPTAELARGLQLENVEIIESAGNLGKGAALRRGFLQARGSVIAQIDADLDLHPESLISLLEILASTDVDIVVGSKVHPNSIVTYPRLRRVQSSVYRLLVRLLFGLRISDTQTGVKVFRREVIDAVGPKLQVDGFTADLEMLAWASRLGYSLSEGPIRLDYQFTSSMPYGAAFSMIGETFRIWRLLASEDIPR